MKCIFCEETSNPARYTPLIRMKFHKTIIHRSLGFVFECFGGDKYSHGEHKFLRLDICQQCFSIYKNISFFDFKTQRVWDKKTRNLVSLYTNNGFVIDSIEMESEYVDKNSPYYYEFLATTPDLFRIRQPYIELLALAFSMKDVSDNQAIAKISLFFVECFSVPDHELFIYYSYFMEKLKSSVGLITICDHLKKSGDEYLNERVRRVVYEIIDMASPEKELAKHLIDSL